MILNPADHPGSLYHNVPAFLDAKVEDILDPNALVVRLYRDEDKPFDRISDPLALLSWTMSRQAQGIPHVSGWVYGKPSQALLDWYQVILGNPRCPQGGLSTINLCRGFDEGLRVIVGSRTISERFFCELSIAESQRFREILRSTCARLQPH